MIKIVLDTNTIISALFWEGNPRRILNLVKGGQYKLITSHEIETELIRVLAYPKFALTSQEILPIITDYNTYSHKVNIANRVEIIKHDPTDNIFLDCAITGQAKYVISGDHHLLDLKSHMDIQIVSPKEFLEIEKIF